jgi:hypothetical protein
MMTLAQRVNKLPTRPRGLMHPRIGRPPSIFSKSRAQFDWPRVGRPYPQWHTTGADRRALGRRQPVAMREFEIGDGARGR